MDDQTLVEVCNRVVDVVASSLEPVLGDPVRRMEAGGRPGQYALDLVADRAAMEVLSEAGLDVLSEESGLHRSGAALVAVVDPVDGSTNASRGIPWYGPSICVLDEHGARAAVVANLASGIRYQAVRGGGAWRDGARLAHSGCARLQQAVVALSGLPRRHLGWAQYRALGAAALELCAVAEGSMDAFVPGSGAHLAPWDYLGGALVCLEAGAHVGDLDGAEWVTSDPAARRALAGASTPELFEQLRAALRDGSQLAGDVTGAGPGPSSDPDG